MITKLQCKERNKTNTVAFVHALWCSL